MIKWIAFLDFSSLYLIISNIFNLKSLHYMFYFLPIKHLLECQTWQNVQHSKYHFYQIKLNIYHKVPIFDLFSYFFTKLFSLLFFPSTKPHLMCIFLMCFDTILYVNIHFSWKFNTISKVHVSHLQLLEPAHSGCDMNDLLWIYCLNVMPH